jgi:hypothetical protein
MNDNEQYIWVYGVVPAGAALDELERRDQLPEVRVVEMGDLGAIVGTAPRNDAKATRDQALAHARVLEAATADAPVIPFRFGTMVPGGDEQVGSDLLDAHHDEFAQVLERFRDCVQLTVKANYDEEPLLREILEKEPEIAELQRQSRQSGEVTRDVKVRLGELISAAVQQRRELDATDILERLKPVSRAAVDDQLESEFMALNAPFLVERDRIQEFEDAVAQVADERQERMHLTLLGPMPVYNFIDLEEPAWA